MYINWLSIKKILFIVTTLYVAPLSATKISIVNLDGAGEGFNDNTPATAIGGNTGITIGEQRLQVFQYAASVWESIIDDSVEIKVEANFDPLTCSASSAVLGSAGTAAVFKSFPNAPLSQTYYPVALANSIAGFDLTSLPDIRATFNVSVDNNNNCMNNKNWYYGLDGNKSANTIDLLFIVMHEIGHGLGFQTFVDVTTGKKFGMPGRNDVYMRNLEDHSLGLTWDQLTDSQRLASITDTGDLHWIGSNVLAKTSSYTGGVNQGHIRQYAPAAISAGSSVSHFDSALTPNELMEPFITSSPKGPGLAIELLKDIGWRVFSDFSPVLGQISDISMSGVSTQAQFVARDDDTAHSSLNFNLTSSNATLIDSSGLSVTDTGILRTLNITPNYGATGTATITLQVSDGVNLVTQSFQLTVTNSSPSISIVAPVNSLDFRLTDFVSFQASANDVEDGTLSSSVEWSSSLDGVLGVGSLVSTSLSMGTHTITASITDSGGLVATAVVSVNIYGDADFDGMNDLWELTSFSTLARDGAGDFDGDGISDLDEYLISISSPDGDLNSDGIVNVVDMLLAQQILNGQIAITQLQLAHGDVAPLINGMPVPDGLFNVADMLIISRKISGLTSF